MHNAGSLLRCPVDLVFVFQYDGKLRRPEISIYSPVAFPDIVISEVCAIVVRSAGTNQFPGKSIVVSFDITVKAHPPSAPKLPLRTVIFRAVMWQNWSLKEPADIKGFP